MAQNQSNLGPPNNPPYQMVDTWLNGLPAGEAYESTDNTVLFVKPKKALWRELKDGCSH